MAATTVRNLCLTTKFKLDAANRQHCKIYTNYRVSGIPDKLDFYFRFLLPADILCDPITGDILPGDDSTSTQDGDGVGPQRPLRLDMIPPPPNTNSNKRSSPLVNKTDSGLPDSQVTNFP